MFREDNPKMFSSKNSLVEVTAASMNLFEALTLPESFSWRKLRRI
jgi:hypothetical protein